MPCVGFFFGIFCSACTWFLSYFHISWGIYNKKNSQWFSLHSFLLLGLLLLPSQFCFLGVCSLASSFFHYLLTMDFLCILFFTGFLTPCKASHPFICCVYLGFAGGFSRSLLFFMGCLFLVALYCLLGYVCGPWFFFYLVIRCFIFFCFFLLMFCSLPVFLFAFFWGGNTCLVH